MARKSFVFIVSLLVLWGAAASAGQTTPKWTITNLKSEISSTATQMVKAGRYEDITAETGQTFIMIHGLFASSDTSPSGKIEEIYLKDGKNNAWHLKGIQFYFPKSRCYFMPESFYGSMFGMIAPGSADNSHTLEIRRQPGETPQFTYHLSKPASELDLLFVIPANKAKEKLTLHFSGTSIVLPKPGSAEKSKP